VSAVLVTLHLSFATVVLNDLISTREASLVV